MGQYSKKGMYSGYDKNHKEIKKIIILLQQKKYLIF